MSEESKENTDNLLAVGKRAERVAVIQKNAFFKLNQRASQLNQLLSVMNHAAGCLHTLKHGGAAQQLGKMVNPGSEFQPAPEQPTGGEYDGGADMALDALICAAAGRMEKIVADDSNWDAENSDRLEDNLIEWAMLEKFSAANQAKLYHTLAKPSSTQQPVVEESHISGVWVARGKSEQGKPVIGVGSSPAAACADFDHVYKTGETRSLPTLGAPKQPKKGNKCQSTRSAGRKKK